MCSASCHQACEKSVFWQGRALQYIEVVYRIADLVWRNVLQCDRKMDQIKINVTQPPCFVLRFGLRQSVLLAVVIVPKLSDDEDIFTLDESFVDSSLDALSCFLFVLVVVGTIEETVAFFDGLDQVNLGLLRPNSNPCTHIVDCIGGLVSRYLPKAEAYKRHVMARG